MHTSNYTYWHDGHECYGFLAYDNNNDQPQPAVLVVHDWTGRNDFACQKAQLLAEMGYVGFAVDMYGQGRIGHNLDEKKALMQPLITDRQLLQARIVAALDAVVAMPEVDNSRIAAIGFCFGGLCVLDLARSGANLKGVVSFHGLLTQPSYNAQPIKAKVLALHGYEDPMVSSTQVDDFCQEMTTAHVDWQIHHYGHAKHAFTNPSAHDETLGTVYNALAAKRSWQAMTNFLEALFKTNDS